MNLLELLRPYYNPDNRDKILHIYIVGPYPTEDFFYNLFGSDRIKFDYRRKNIITFLVDKSSYDKAIEIRKSLIKDECCYDNQFVIKAISGDKGRFVHSKMYYFEIEKPSGMIYTCLITGSGNASTRAYSFESDEYKNAEINLVTTIKQEDRNFIENYFNFIENDTNILHIKTADMKIYFPNIECVDIKEQYQYSTLSSWILNGYIYHKHSKVNDLGKVRIKLKKGVEAGSVFTDLAKDYKFIGKGDIQSLSYSYTGKDIEDTKDDNDNIKKSFLCETSYGYWAPKELKENIDNEIKEQNNTNKKEMLEIISKLKDDEINAKVQDIVDKINEFFEKLDESTRDLYFKVNDKNKKLDKGFYKNDIQRQIVRQNKQCQNKKFYERFINGYDSFNASYLENCIDDLTYEVSDYIDTKLKSNKMVFNYVCNTVKKIKKQLNTKNIDIDEKFLEENLGKIIENLKKIVEEYNTK